jgi:hypothetical protein
MPRFGRLVPPWRIVDRLGERPLRLTRGRAENRDARTLSAVSTPRTHGKEGEFGRRALPVTAPRISAPGVSPLLLDFSVLFVDPNRNRLRIFLRRSDRLLDGLFLCRRLRASHGCATALTEPTVPLSLQHQCASLFAPVVATEGCVVFRAPGIRAREGYDSRATAPSLALKACNDKHDSHVLQHLLVSQRADHLVEADAVRISFSRSLNRNWLATPSPRHLLCQGGCRVPGDRAHERRHGDPG